MTSDDLWAFEVVARAQFPELRIEFKEDSFVQKVIGYLMYPFNPAYMTRYTSTFAPVVYFPSRAYYEANPKGSMILLAHELVHLLDTKRMPFWFRFSYLFPQILSPIAFALYLCLAREHAWPLLVLFVGVILSALVARMSMAAFFVTAFLVIAGSTCLSLVFSGWSHVAFLVGLLLLVPWPSPGRVWWERRGYAMNIAIYQWNFGCVPQILQESVHRCFVGPSYFFMSWGQQATTDWIHETAQRAASGELAKDYPYGVVLDFLRGRNLVRDGK